MDREEAKKIEYEWVKDEWQMLGIVEVEEKIDQIYDDFESRTCGNCRYNDDMCTYQESIKVFSKVTRGVEHMLDFTDFGCNRFEKEEDE